MLQAAIEIAAQAHADQWREGATPLPYVTHAIEVLINLRHVGNVTDPDMLCAAVLHDTVECGCMTLQQIEKGFGKRVSALVGELTRTEPTLTQTLGLSKDEVWQLRADMLVEEVAKMSPEAQQIKLADRLANFQEALRTKKGKKLARYITKTQRILAAIPRATNKPLWDAIATVMNRP